MHTMIRTQMFTCCCDFDIESWTILWRGEAATHEALQVEQRPC